MNVIFGIILCSCLVPGNFAFFTQMFGPSGMFGSFGGFGGTPQQGTTSGASPQPGPPPTCKTSQCLPYTLLGRGKNYEFRRYAPVMMAASGSSTTWMPDMVTFSRLRGYLAGGKNSEMLAMNITYPFLKPQTESPVKIMLAALPLRQQDSPPEPINPNVRIERIPAMDVYTRSYTTNMFTDNHDAAIHKFKTELGPTVRVTPNLAFVAEYGSPMNIFNRKAEIWLVSESSASGVVTALDAPSVSNNAP